jgi:hypothetical protein
MGRIFAICSVRVVLLCGLMILGLASALASGQHHGPHQRSGANSGYCPPGTCGLSGGTHAHSDVKDCSPANCRH